MQKYIAKSTIFLCVVSFCLPFAPSSSAIEVELRSPKPSSASPKPENLKGSFGVAWQHQQHANQFLEIGDNARAIEFFKKAVAAYEDSIRRKTEVKASREAITDSQKGLQQAADNAAEEVVAQSALFLYLEEKSGKKVQIPTFPENSLLTWYQEQLASVGDEAENQYKLVYQVVLIARSLFDKESVDQKRRGLRVARDVAVFTLETLKDEKLSAQICDTFLIPNLGVARNKRWQQLSKEQILENAIYIYSKAGRGEQLVTSCKLLLDNSRSANAADSARLKLALALESQSKFDEVTCPQKGSPEFK